MWTVEKAKAEFAQVVERAGAGEPQVISAVEPCVVLSLAEYERLKGARNFPHLGLWLVENAPHIGDLDLPPRHSDRPTPFDDWSDEELGAE